MTSEEGVFYSTIDADSEGSEGKYYVFSDDELKKTLEKEEIDLLNEYLLDLNKPNFEGNHHLHLHRKKKMISKKISKSLCLSLRNFLLIENRKCFLVWIKRFYYRGTVYI